MIKLLTALILISPLFAKEPAAENTAIKPVSRMNEGWWKKRQEGFNKQAAAAPHDLLFIGDSITHYWNRDANDLWKKYYEPRKALNLAASGDRTEHVIWRLDNGNLKNQENAKVAVIMIGTNNTGHKEQAAEETAAGITKIVSQVKTTCPKAKILLLGVFPRGWKADDSKRKLNVAINGIIAKLHDGKTVHFLDLSKHFLLENGDLNKELVPDGLHPKAAGYKVWAEAMEPKLKELGL